LFLPAPLWEKGRGKGSNKKSRPWLGRLFALAVVVYLLALTVAILTENRSLIIRTTRRTTIREMLKIGYIWLVGISPDYRQK
jgi:hypothetical protein